MLTTLLRTAKTARQALMAAGLTAAFFSLPLMMAGGGGSYFVASDAQNAQLMGTGDDDPVVYMADVQALLSRSEVEATDVAGEDSSKSSKASRDGKKGGGPGVAATSKVGRAFGPRGQHLSGERVVPDMSNKRRIVAARSRARGTSKCATPADGIDHMGGENYNMRRTLIQHYTGNVRAAMGLAAVAWHKDARGRKDGFQVGRIRCGTPLAQVGIRNGDVIHAINGKRVRSIPAAFTAVRRVTRNEIVVVDITRGGRRIRKTVRVI